MRSLEQKCQQVTYSQNVDTPPATGVGVPTIPDVYKTCSITRHTNYCSKGFYYEFLFTLYTDAPRRTQACTEASAAEDFRGSSPYGEREQQETINGLPPLRLVWQTTDHRALERGQRPPPQAHSGQRPISAREGSREPLKRPTRRGHTEREGSGSPEHRSPSEIRQDRRSEPNGAYEQQLMDHRSGSPGLGGRRGVRMWILRGRPSRGAGRRVSCSSSFFVRAESPLTFFGRAPGMELCHSPPRGAPEELVPGVARGAAAAALGLNSCQKRPWVQLVMSAHRTGSPIHQGGQRGTGCGSSRTAGLAMARDWQFGAR